MPLTRIIYFSESRIGIKRRQTAIAELQAVAVARNRPDGISGVLLHDEDWFLQALEGEPGAVEATYDRIAKDPRHANISRVSQNLVQGRLFGPWSMGFAERTPDNLRHFGDHWFNKGMNPTAMREQDMLALMKRVSEQVLSTRLAKAPILR